MLREEGQKLSAAASHTCAHSTSYLSLSFAWLKLDIKKYLPNLVLCIMLCLQFENLSLLTS